MGVYVLVWVNVLVGVGVQSGVFVGVQVAVGVVVFVGVFVTVGVQVPPPGGTPDSGSDTLPEDSPTNVPLEYKAKWWSLYHGPVCVPSQVVCPLGIPE